jgi:hypothetical protein
VRDCANRELLLKEPEPGTGLAAVARRKRAALTVAVMALCVAVARVVAGTWIGTFLHA